RRDAGESVQRDASDEGPRRGDEARQEQRGHTYDRGDGRDALGSEDPTAQAGGNEAARGEEGDTAEHRQRGDSTDRDVERSRDLWAEHDEGISVRVVSGRHRAGRE